MHFILDFFKTISPQANITQSSINSLHTACYRPGVYINFVFQVAEIWLASENGPSTDWQNPQSVQQSNQVKDRYVVGPRMDNVKDWMSPGSLCPWLGFL